ncbi:membrane protein [Spirochaetota bacterium]
MRKLIFTLVACFFGSTLVFAQALGTSLGNPLATVKLVKTEVISDKFFKEEVQKLEKLTGQSLTADQRKSYLEDIINDKLFYQMCERDGIKVSDGEVDSIIARVRAQRPAGESDAQFSAFLASQGIPFDQFKTYYKKQLLVQRWLMTAKAKEIAAIAPVSAADVLAYYELKKAELIRPDTAVLSILFYRFKDASAAEREKGAALMKRLSERLAKGESFDALRFAAKEGGYEATNTPEYFARSEASIAQFGKAFYDMAFSLKNGEHSIPFETSQGWWIIKRLDFLAQKQLELGDAIRPGQPGTVQDLISQELASQKENAFIQKAFIDLFAQLRKQAEIVYKGTP